MNFNGFIGNDEVKAALQVAFTSARFSQTIIIEGDKGLGKKTIAKHIAKAFVCTSDDKPCGVCKGCIKAVAGSHPDIRLIEGSGVSGNIAVDAVRAMVEDAYRKPEEADTNIYLLFIKNLISESSQNKLLKVIEEPPGNALFIIVVNSEKSLLSTIRSRAVTYSLSSVNEELAAQYVSEQKNISYNDALSLAKLCGSNIGNMLTGETEAVTIATEIAENFDSSDEDKLLAITFVLIKNRDLFYEVLEKLMYIFRDAYNIYLGDGNCIGVCPEQSKKIAGAYRKKNLLEFPSVCAQYMPLVRKNINMNLLVTDFCVRIREAAQKF